MGITNRRASYRIPTHLFLNEIVRDKAHRCMAVNLSSSGIFLNRLLQPMQRPDPVVGLEFQLPETSEVIWARGEARFDRLDPYFHGTGIEFTGMARAHKRLLQDYVQERRDHALQALLRKVRRSRLH